MGNGFMKKVLPEANLQGSELRSYGRYRGFYVSIRVENSAYTIAINAKCVSEDVASRIQAFLLKYKIEQKAVSLAVYEDSSIRMVVAGGSWGPPIKKINAAVDDVVRFLQSEDCTSGCKVCGNTESSWYNINKNYENLCGNCIGELNVALEDHKEKKRSGKSNIITGLVGALLGSLIGVACWVLIYKLGYIAAITGVVMVVCTFKGYELLGGCLDIKGIIVSCLLSIVMLYFANQISWAWEIFNVFKAEYQITFFDAFRSTMDILKEVGMTREFYGDLAMGYIFTVIGGATVIIGALKGAKGNYKIEKVN